MAGADGDPEDGTDAGSGDGGGDARSDPGEDHGGRPCPRCGEPMYRRHCKYVCPNHGVVMDCSDPFYL